MLQVVRKLKIMKYGLKELNNQDFRSIVCDCQEDREAMMKAQQLLQQDPMYVDYQVNEKEKYQKFKQTSYKAEIYLQQRSKATWIKIGDDNTKYFFSVIKHRSLQQTTTQLKDDSGNWHTDPEVISKMLVDYYIELLGKKCSQRMRAYGNFFKYGQCLTVDQQVELLKAYTLKDIKIAMFQIDSNKSPGPDGYGSGFFKSAWETIWTYITYAILEFLRNGKLLRQLNTTNIVLIPKVTAPKSTSQFRPISCCNVYGTQHLDMSRLDATLWEENHTKMLDENRIKEGLRHDDLMIFCRGDVGSVTRVMEALTHFSEVTGLVVNVDKSNLFVAGVDDETQGKLLKMTGFTLGQLLIKYLGLPLSSKKWTRVGCQQLIMKITNRINIGYSKLLSYAGRIQVVTAVLFSIHNFWGSVFILPKSILKEVDKIYRNYIWGSNEEKRKVPLVAWEKICRPKKFGGLNVKGCNNWNVASVGKLLWQLSEKQDILWVKWVHGLYMRNDVSIWEHTPPQDCSWYWKKLNALKNNMRNWYIQGRYALTHPGQYSISASYNAMLGEMNRLKIANLIWTSVAQPKHRMIMWLAVQGRLLTKERMLHLNIHVDNEKCCLCRSQVMETQLYLFAHCAWLGQVKAEIFSWAGMQVYPSKARQVLERINRKHCRQFYKEVVAAIWSAIVYPNWRARN
ncbi:hypothetical protein MTR67_018630 [Solanum verrucosum]|uniref:Reverse transcriptase zinc-binding domain-containing protein n=1 Tax=Solanum verrucosum TaxID=315347 RepID=A0AAF0QQ57_SOLVR|nr:hypothetical protein MTR67_018630 [Solanum verrucosum]